MIMISTLSLPFYRLALAAALASCLCCLPQPDLRAAERQPDGDGSVSLEGELKLWHKVTVDLSGPYAHEQDEQPNPFTDHSYFVSFTHESGAPTYTVPGYFAADGDAGDSSAESGTVWRAHFAPDRTGQWNYRVSFRSGPDAAIDPASGSPRAPYHGNAGSFEVGPSDKRGRDFRAHGRLEYVGGHYLQFADSKRFFLKAGPDAPETFLAYEDFDGTVTHNPRRGPLKSWRPHAGDWQSGDPTWQGGKGKGMIGALNYLASKGVNAFSFLPYNAGGDGDNVWPYTARDAKFHFDCSKLDQWGIVFEHAQARGLYLHFKLQEQEMDDNRAGAQRRPEIVPTSLDGGLLGRERKLYLRELIARFSHNLALNWNLGEENTQSAEEQSDMAEYILNLDPYDHHIVVHTFPPQQDRVYSALIGTQSVLTGASLQNHWDVTHQRTLKWVNESRAAGRPWVVANDEQGPAGLGVPPDPGYEGFDGWAGEGEDRYSAHDIRKRTLWGNLMAGGAGVEYYFGYRLPQNDLVCEDFRSRDLSWDYCRYALEFFQENGIPFQTMSNANALVGNEESNNSVYCLAKPGEAYVVYLPEGREISLDLRDDKGSFSVHWYDPRRGGKLQSGSIRRVQGGKAADLGRPPAEPEEDWAILVRKR